MDGIRPELLEALVLRRALLGGVAKAGEKTYVDYGYRLGRHLTGTFTELIEDGSLTLADEHCGLRRVQVTEAGRTRYAQVHDILRWNR